MTNWRDPHTQQKITEIAADYFYPGTNIRHNFVDFIKALHAHDICVDWHDLHVLLTASRPNSSDHRQTEWQMKQSLDHHNIFDVPPHISQFLADYLSDRRIDSILDPCPESGMLLADMALRLNSSRNVGICRNQELLSFVQSMGSYPPIDWQLGPPNAKVDRFDLIIGFPPVHQVWSVSPAAEEDTSPSHLNPSDQLILNACQHLSPDGEAIFLVTEGFFSRWQGSMRVVLRQHGLALHSVISLPIFSIPGDVPIYLAFIRQGDQEKLWVGAMSRDLQRNKLLVNNLKQRLPDEETSLGRLTSLDTFFGYHLFLLQDRIERLGRESGLVAKPLVEIVTQIDMAKHGKFPGVEDQSNTVYLPLTGHSDALSMSSELKLPANNYAQLVINPKEAVAGYVAGFFNTPLGLAIREKAQHQTNVRRRAHHAAKYITKNTIQQMRVYLPDVPTQLKVIELETNLRSLGGELESMRDELWSAPLSANDICARLDRTIEPEVQKVLFERWVESMPFPLATILWAYHACNRDSKAQYEHLLNFFEALCEFYAILLLSAFASKPRLLRGEEVRWSLSKLPPGSLERPTFGTWCSVFRELASIVRRMSRREDPVCQELFHTHDEKLLDSLSSEVLVRIFDETRNLRNLWKGHTGIIGPNSEEAQRRCTVLESHLSKMRQILNFSWRRYRLIQPASGDFAKGVYHYQARLVVGTRTPFRQDTLELEHPLERDQLYLIDARERQALQLLPFVKILSAPPSAQNACYFYSNKIRGQLRFLSYHFEPESEITNDFPDTAEALAYLLKLANS